MRLRFLGAPRVSKLSPVVADLPATCKEEVTENVEAEKISLSTPATDAASPRQLRQRRSGVGLWAIRRQKLERAQLRPRIVVRMSRLRGRRTTADFGSATLHVKRRSRHSLLARHTPPTVTTDKSTSLDVMETRRGAANTVKDTGMDPANGVKLEKMKEDEVRDDAESGQVQDNESEKKPAGDTVNSRPKRQIMQKKMVSHRSVYKYSILFINIQSVHRSHDVI